MPTDTERFWSRVEKRGPDDCWPWAAGLHTRGYGVIKWNGESQSAHRVAYELAYGPIPAGDRVLQDCRNPACCNPAHLYLGAYPATRKRHATPPAPKQPRPLPTALERERDRLRERVRELEEVIRDLERSR